MDIWSPFFRLSDWPDVTFSVFIHGTEDCSYSMTGAKPGLYQQIKKNADRSDLDVVMAFCMTRINYQCIEDMLKEWSNTSVKGIVFDSMPLWKRKGTSYGSTGSKGTWGIYQCERSDTSLDADIADEITKNYPFSRISFSYDPVGKPKIPCQLGPDAYYSRWGCILPFLLNAAHVQELLNISIRCLGLEQTHRPV